MKTEGLLGTRIVSAVHDRDVSRQPGTGLADVCTGLHTHGSHGRPYEDIVVCESSARADWTFVKGRTHTTVQGKSPDAAVFCWWLVVGRDISTWVRVSVTGTCRKHLSVEKRRTCKGFWRADERADDAGLFRTQDSTVEK